LFIVVCFLSVLLGVFGLSFSFSSFCAKLNHTKPIWLSSEAENLQISPKISNIGAYYKKIGKKAEKYKNNKRVKERS
jgi:hypothetical protein